MFLLNFSLSFFKVHIKVIIESLIKCNSVEPGIRKSSEVGIDRKNTISVDITHTIIIAEEVNLHQAIIAPALTPWVLYLPVTNSSAVLVFLDFIAIYSDSVSNIFAHIVTAWVFFPITAAL